MEAATCPAAVDPIYSIYRDEEDFQELLEDFLSAAQTRQAVLRESFESGAIDSIRSQAHQIKGAGGGYGFEGLSELAAQLEEVCKDQDAHPEDIAPLLDGVVDYLSRIRI